jgi:hypothetical protein
MFFIVVYIQSYCPASAQGAVPSHPPPAARRHSPPRRLATSPPHAPRRPRAKPLSRNIVCTLDRMGRGGGWTRVHYAHLAARWRQPERAAGCPS